ncbi:MAG: hypothetical protein H7Z14_14250, partial [Anaerolineae bacterium]|nr:hypothetical protein [Phycisphaerae bacterium]
MHSICSLACASLVALAASTSSHAALVDIATIQTFGGNSSVATAISDFGLVTGAASTLEDQTRAFQFNVNSSNLSNLGTVADGGNSFGYAINATGQVAGDALAANNKYHAVRSTGAMSLADLHPAGDQLYSHAYGINDAGVIVGSANTVTSGNRRLAFRMDGNLRTT